MLGNLEIGYLVCMFQLASNVCWLTIFYAYNNFSFDVKTNELPFVFMVHSFGDEVIFQPTFFGTFEIMIFSHDEQARLMFFLLKIK